MFGVWTFSQLCWLKSIVMRQNGHFLRVLDIETVQAHGGDFLNPNQLLSYSIFGVAVQEGIQWTSPNMILGKKEHLHIMQAFIGIYEEPA